MKRFATTFAIAALLAGAAPHAARAQTTAPAAAAPAPTIDQLIADLGSDDFARREQAEDALVQRGGEALPTIQKLIATTEDVDLKERLQSAATRIDREALLLPTLVNIDKTFAKPIDAFTALAAAVNLELVCDDAESEAASAETPVTVSAKNEPWLVVLDRTTAQTGVATRIDEGRLVLIQQEKIPRNRPSCATASLMVSADVARRRATYDISRDATNRNASITLSLLTEPKTRFRGVGPAIVLKQIVDGDGKSLMVQGARGQFSRQSARKMIGSINFTDANGKIAVLEGELVGEVVSRMEELKIDNLQTALPAQLSSVINGDITFKSLTKNDKNWTLTGSAPVSPMTGSSAMYTELEAAVRSQGLQVFDQNGKPMTCAFKQGNNNGLLMEMVLTLTSSDAEAKPTKLRWQVASQTREVKVPFILRDLALP